jgi:hypothetical protein
MMTKSIESRPVFLEYSARCTQRPAFARFGEQASKLAEQLKTGA